MNEPGLEKNKGMPTIQHSLNSHGIAGFFVFVFDFVAYLFSNYNESVLHT